LLFNRFFFQLSIRALVAEIQPDKVVQWCADGEFLGPAFSASRMQHVSDLRLKFALRPHHVWKYGRHPICDGWLRLGEEKKEERRTNYRTKIQCPHLLRRAAIIKNEAALPE